MPDDALRAEFVRKIQQVLERRSCYVGAFDGRGNRDQEALDHLVENVKKMGQSKPTRIDLAKATVGDFEGWLQMLMAPEMSIARRLKSTGRAL